GRHQQTSDNGKLPCTCHQPGRTIGRCEGKRCIKDTKPNRDPEHPLCPMLFYLVPQHSKVPTGQDDQQEKGKHPKEPQGCTPYPTATSQGHQSVHDKVTAKNSEARSPRKRALYELRILFVN